MQTIKQKTDLTKPKSLKERIRLVEHALLLLDDAARLLVEAGEKDFAKPIDGHRYHVGMTLYKLYKE